jgi:hypothetical protein
MRKDLESAYRATNYRVQVDDAAFVLQVDQHSASLAALLQSLHANCAALLTAFNPGSEPHDAAWNHAAQRALQAELAAAGYIWYAARNEDPAGAWPVEDSVLVPGLGVVAAHAIAARYGQVAFLWSEADATPRLVEAAAGLG